MGGFRLLAELHLEGSAPAAGVARFFLGIADIYQNAYKIVGPALAYSH